MTDPYIKLLVTLSPSMPHFHRFSTDKRIDGIRINSAMMELDELDNEFKAVASSNHTVPLWYDIKGRQLRIREVHPNGDHVELVMNHRIEVQTPTVVLFKGGEDSAILEGFREKDGRQQLVFKPGAPKFNLKSGESICIRDKSFRIKGSTFPDYEIEKIKRVVKSGLFAKYVLSYVESNQDIEQFRQFVGPDAEIMAKIENPRGLNYVMQEFKPEPNLSLMAARGDLYIEVQRPHDILAAQRVIIRADPHACVGSRILLSCVNKAVPDAVDFSELAWLYDIGYRSMMLCDDLCIKEDRLSRAVNAFHEFRSIYAKVTERITRGTPPPTLELRKVGIRNKFTAAMAALVGK